VHASCVYVATVAGALGDAMGGAGVSVLFVLDFA
jgi:hypothetical protein